MKKSDKEKIKDLLNIGDWVELRLPPDMDIFSSNNKTDNPYDLFCQWVFLSVEKRDWMTVSDIQLTEKDSLSLDILAKEWLKKKLKLKGKLLTNNFLFLSLERSPGVISGKPDGYVYVRRNKRD